MKRKSAGSSVFAATNPHKPRLAQIVDVWNWSQMKVAVIRRSVLGNWHKQLHNHGHDLEFRKPLRKEID